jgi:GNAT superfamily N-acetyltransferase
VRLLSGDWKLTRFWVALTTKFEEYSLSCKYKRRDADFDRLKAFENNIAAIDKEVFSDAVDKWSMELLVTDVKYRRRGAATALVKWGTQKADEEGVPCRVEASPMGRPIYRSCGFVDIKPWKVTAQGQNETLEFWVMRREPNRQAANSPV